MVEKLVTLGKKGGLHGRRQAIAEIKDVAMVKKLFEVLGPRYAARPAVISASSRRASAMATTPPLAVIEFVDRDVDAKGKDSGPVAVEAEAA